jgi:membrane protein implicated in regulation of membrane protease activity
MELLWWHWLVIGLLLVLVELATPGGFFVIFFGLSALIVGALAGFGLAGPVWTQLLLFSVLSVASLVLFRARLLRAFQRDPQRPAVDTLVGEIGHVDFTIEPGQVGRIEVHGAAWSARNTSSSALPTGMRCRVVRVKGLMLDIEPEGAHS